MNDYREEVYRLMLTINRCTGVYYEIAKKMGVKENTLLLLDILSDKRQHSQKQICDDWHMPKTTLNTIIKECVSSGHVVLLTQRKSKEKLIALTDSGQIFADEITQKMKEAVQRSMEKIKKEYSTDFILVFEKYVEYLENEYTNGWER
ncbi:MarR family transcriptional regulator [Clostridium sp. AF18-27]|jgi:DNA-binding MarR family transcriptional regulator|uniref:MarR family transcriptional regulator n=1 Tax=Enterocloster lavalensis TaxID=460384 RepID=UPI000E52B579|nr:MarR family transcriptional regulator [Enterocloster lavalensis]MBS5603801.1 MarR family transcriptional regulator [Enterocloster asparagiformis]MCB6343051.1 MarR family transcriptional regulator [Enterocloster lavalensis]RHR51432.1 MarR family transcriptional regulator [Clostridium sp. AF18-27]